MTDLDIMRSLLADFRAPEPVMVVTHVYGSNRDASGDAHTDPLTGQEFQAAASDPTSEGSSFDLDDVRRAFRRYWNNEGNDHHG